MSWQEKQKQSILEHKRRNIERLEKEEKYHDLEIERLEKELEVMREEMRLLENEERELLETERKNVLDREFGVKSAKLNHIDQVKGVNRYNESRFKLVERQRIHSGSYINSSVKKHPVNDENVHTFAGGAMMRIGGNLHRLDEDLDRKSRMAFSNGRVGNDILGHR